MFASPCRQISAIRAVDAGQPDVGQGVDDTGPSATDGRSAGQGRHHHPLVHQVQRGGQIERGQRLGAAARRAFRGDERGRQVDPLLHQTRPRWRGTRGCCSRASAAGPGGRRMRAEGTEEDLDAAADAPRAGRSAWSPWRRRSRCPRRLISGSSSDSSTASLDGEVEVERRPGDAGALGQVVDRDVGEGPLLDAAGSAVSRIACCRSSPEGRGGPTAATGAGGGHGPDLNTVSTLSTHR